MDQDIKGCNEFSFAFPFAALAYDYQLRHIKGRYERFSIIKYLIIIFYVGIMIAALIWINSDPAYIESKNQNTYIIGCTEEEDIDTCGERQ